MKKTLIILAALLLTGSFLLQGCHSNNENLPHDSSKEKSAVTNPNAVNPSTGKRIGIQPPPP